MEDLSSSEDAKPPGSSKSPTKMGPGVSRELANWS